HRVVMLLLIATRPTLVPYTTLFRSDDDREEHRGQRAGGEDERPGGAVWAGRRGPRRRREKGLADRWGRVCRHGRRHRLLEQGSRDRKSTRLNSSHDQN